MKRTKTREEIARNRIARIDSPSLRAIRPAAGLNRLPQMIKPAPSILENKLGRPSTTPRSEVQGLSSPYTHRKWRRRRDRQLALEPMCCFCKAEGRLVVATVADHIVPHRGNVDAFWNGELQSLCAHHHGVKGRMEKDGLA